MGREGGLYACSGWGWNWFEGRLGGLRGGFFFFFLIKHSLPSLPAFPLSAYSCRDGEGRVRGVGGGGA